MIGLYRSKVNLGAISISDTQAAFINKRLFTREQKGMLFDALLKYISGSIVALTDADVEGVFLVIVTMSTGLKTLEVIDDSEEGENQ